MGPRPLTCCGAEGLTAPFLSVEQKLGPKPAHLKGQDGFVVLAVPCRVHESAVIFSTVTHLGFPGDSAVKNLPAMQEPQEIRVRSLGREDPLGEGMATLSSILAWRIPWTEEPGGL